MNVYSMSANTPPNVTGEHTSRFIADVVFCCCLWGVLLYFLCFFCLFFWCCCFCVVFCVRFFVVFGVFCVFGFCFGVAVKLYHS